MLKIENLSYTYPKQRQATIDGLSLEVNEGGVYGLLGPNGAGKSTLLYLICGLLTPQTGSVTLHGLNTRRRLPSTLADIFIVPEEFELPAVKLSTYVKETSRFYPRFSHETMQRNLQMFELEGNPSLGALSMGQKKKVYMSFALACNTPLMLMDEPTNGLDIPGKAAFRRFIAANMTDERSVIISTHQVADINRLLDHVIILDAHRVMLNASTQDIMDRLAFLSTDDSSVIEQAYYAVPSLKGAQVVLPAGDVQTEIDLETLFGFATTQPEKLASVFSSPLTASNDEQ